MFKSILQQKNRGLRVGACSLVLGISSLFLATGSAVAAQITLTDTLNNGTLRCTEYSGTWCITGMDGDFIVVEQAGGYVGDGINERYVGQFDLTDNPADYDVFKSGAYSVQSAHLGINLKPWFGSETDDLFLGGVKTSSNAVIGIGTITFYDLGFLFSDIVDPRADFTLNVNLLDWYTSSAIMDAITGGDSDGGIWFQLADDTIVTSVTLTVTAVENPEPASLILLGTGLVGMAAWRFRKTCQNQ